LDSVGFSEEGNLWIQLLTKYPDIGRRRMTMTTNLCIISVPNVREILYKFKRMGERFNIRNIFKTKYT
jgi:hypothetical protein